VTKSNITKGKDLILGTWWTKLWSLWKSLEERMHLLISSTWFQHMKVTSIL